MTRARDLAKGTFSGDLTVDTNTLFVDSANNRVGVGTASPTETLDVSGNIRALGANSRVLFGPDGFEAGIKYATDASLQIASRTGEPITFTNGHDGTERLRILSTGGITFNGDTAAANALDDYEEGTWTPTWIVASGSITANSNTSGRYTKIGRVVSIMGYISYQSNSPDATGVVSVGGLPFTSVTSGFGQSGNQAGGITSFATGLFASNAPNVGRIDSNNTIIRPNITGATGGTELQFSNFGLGANFSQFVFQGQYIVNT